MLSRRKTWKGKPKTQSNHKKATCDMNRAPAGSPNNPTQTSLRSRIPGKNLQCHRLSSHRQKSCWKLGHRTTTLVTWSQKHQLMYGIHYCHHGMFLRAPKFDMFWHLMWPGKHIVLSTASCGARKSHNQVNPICHLQWGNRFNFWRLHEVAHPQPLQATIPVAGPTAPPSGRTKSSRPNRVDLGVFRS